MSKLLELLIRSGEFRLGWNGLTAKGGLPVLFAFIVIILLLIR